MLIVYGSLYPWAFEPRHVEGGALRFLLHRWDSWRNPYLIRDIFVNIVLYVPLGLSGHLAFRKRFGLFGPVLFAFALSVSMELAQVFEPIRQASMVDVLCNTGGAAIGVLIGVSTRSRAIARAGASLADRGAALLAAGWLAYLLFPFVPELSRAPIHRKAALFIHTPVLSSLPAISAIAIWYAAGLLLQGAGIRFARLWLALSLLAVPAQILIVDRLPSIPELCGAAAGVALFALRPRLANVTAWEAWGFLLLIAFSGLWPPQFASQPNDFSPIPFKPLLRMDGQTALRIMLNELFYYGAAIWLLNASGRRRWQAVVFVAGVVTAVELARMYLPGAAPGITAPLLAVLAGYVLNAVSPNEPQTAG